MIYFLFQNSGFKILHRNIQETCATRSRCISNAKRGPGAPGGKVYFGCGFVQFQHNTEIDIINHLSLLATTHTI